MWLETGRGKQDVAAAHGLNGPSSEQMGRSCPGDCQRKKLEGAPGERELGHVLPVASEGPSVVCQRERQSHLLSEPLP